MYPTANFREWSGIHFFFPKSSRPISRDKHEFSLLYLLKIQPGLVEAGNKVLFNKRSDDEHR
jgi:hypothetical protein